LFDSYYQKVYMTLSTIGSDAMSTSAEMTKLTRGPGSKSEKMRTLARAGYTRAEIARHLGTSYQFVRNVLVREEERKAEGAQPSTAVENSRGEESVGADRLRMGASGEIVLPASMRSALGLRPGDSLIATIEDGEVRMMTLSTAIRKAREIVRQYVPKDVSLVDELLEDRRREFERETSK
jgi:bifunctional DNA-binding transcriptional regulator/antitoxin component of YhaV-PrlF toxin-antitoxin module